MTGKATASCLVRVPVAGRTDRVDGDQQNPIVRQTIDAQSIQIPQPIRSLREPGSDNIALTERVANDFPEAIPVAPSELDVIETYLGALLDEVLAANVIDD